MTVARRGLRQLVSALVIAVLALFAVATVPTFAATQKETFTYPDAISNIRVTNITHPEGQTQQWDELRIDADWAVPDSAKGGGTFGMELPPELARFGTSFDLKNEAGAVVGSCLPSEARPVVLTCTLSDFVNDKHNVKGTLWFKVTARSATEGTPATFNFKVNDQDVPVDIPGGQGIGYHNPAPENPRKLSSPNDGGEIAWSIQIPSTSIKNGTIDLADQLRANSVADELEGHELIGLGDGGYFVVQFRPTDADGNFDPSGWVVVDAANYTHTFPQGAGETSFAVNLTNLDPAKTGTYMIQYKTKAADQLVVGDKYGNDYTINGEARSAVYEHKISGGGDGDGDALVRFSIAKAISGLEDTSAIPAGTEFTVTYAVGNDSHELKFAAGEENRVQSLRYPVGSTFVIKEVNLPTLEGIEWDNYTITGEGVVDKGQGVYELTPAAAGTVKLSLENVVKPPVTEEPKEETPSVKIIKKDENGNDADEAADAADLTELKGAVGLNFTITNNGTEDLTDIKVTDVVTAGDAKVENLSCTFEDDSTGTTWAGPFKVGDSFECTADLSGVKAGDPHANNATVTGVGVVSGKTVKDENPYNAKVVEETTPPATDEPSTPAPSTEAPAPSDEPSQPAAEQPKDNLANTGANSIGAAVLGGLLLVAGGILVAQRRRTAAAEHSE